MISTITNAIYAVSAGVALSRFRLPMALAMILLGVCSGMYHGMVWLGDPSLFWQNADVSAIYIVLGLFPYTITRKKIWLWMAVPVGVLILNKFGYIGEGAWNSTLMVPLISIPLLLAGYFRIKPILFWNALVLVLFAYGYNWIGGHFDMTTWGYDQPHAWWHLLSGTAFTMLVAGVPVRWYRERELNVMTWLYSIGRRS